MIKPINLKSENRCYLLFGEDEWVKNETLKQIKHYFLPRGEDLMNSLEVEGKEATVRGINDFCETMPFFADIKIMVVHNSGFFKTGRKDESEALIGLLPHLPEYSVLVFVETEVDKRSKAYKVMQKTYVTFACEYPGDEEVATLLKEWNKEQGIKMDSTVMHYFMVNMPKNITYMMNELSKLTAYCMESIVTREAIDMVCTFALEQVVFNLLNEMTVKNAGRALEIYAKLIESKESPIGILVLIGRQYRLILQIKYLMRNGLQAKSIGGQLGIPYFAVSQMMKQAQSLGFRELEEIIAACLEADIHIKTGKMEPVKCIEMLILKCIYIA